ncbi:MAG TPA: GAF domain-containing protein, partial [Anaerolineales bacterium]|nr:GAF domain-containing protein [Anaerolineales bacterium]
MLTSIRRFFSSPVFEDEDKTRRARLLHVILMAEAGVLLLAILGTLVTVISTGANRTGELVVMIVSSLAIILWRFLMWRGRVSLAGIGMITIFVASVTLILASGGTIRSSGVIFLPLVVVMATLLIGRRAGLVTFIVISLIGIGLVEGEINGLLPAPDNSISFSSNAIVMGGIGLTTVLLYLATQGTDEALDRAHRNEKEVRALASTLEQRVEERTHELEERSNELAKVQEHTQSLLTELDEASRLARLANYVLKPDAQTVVFSDLFYELLHTTAEQEGGYELPIPQAVQRFVHPEDAPRLLEDIESLGTARMEGDLEYRLQDANGAVRTFSLRFDVETGEEGYSTGVKGVVQDITERKQAEAALAKRAAELQTVAEVSTAVTTIQDVETLLQEVVDLTKERFHLYHAHVYLLNEAGDTLLLRAGAGEAGRVMTTQGRTIPLDHQSSLVARAGRTQQAVVVNDVSQAPDFLPNPLLPNTKSEMAVPLLIGERVLGVLDVQSDQLAYFTDDDQRIQTILADQVAVAISNAAQYTREQAQAQRLSSLVENTAGFTNPQIGMDVLMNLIVRNAIQLLEADDAGLWLTISEDEIELKSNRHNDHLVGTRLKLGEGLSGRTFETGQVFRVGDYAAWSGRALTETSIRVAMAVPLIWQGKPIGALALTREKIGYAFTEENERMTQLFASQAASAIENVRAFERAQRTLHELDTLTRRLTREGWQTYLNENERDRIGYIFEADHLVPLQENGQSEHEAEKTFIQPVVL